MSFKKTLRSATELPHFVLLFDNAKKAETSTGKKNKHNNKTTQQEAKNKTSAPIAASSSLCLSPQAYKGTNRRKKKEC